MKQNSNPEIEIIKNENLAYDKVIALAKCWWLMPIILTTQEAEIKRIVVQSQPRQIVHETLSQNSGGGVVQSVGPECKPQYHQKKKRHCVKSAVKDELLGK
jgi:hypothetical protein